jgi:hypothetical protein
MVRHSARVRRTMDIAACERAASARRTPASARCGFRGALHEPGSPAADPAHRQNRIEQRAAILFLAVIVVVAV